MGDHRSGPSRAEGEEPETPQTGEDDKGGGKQNDGSSAEEPSPEQSSGPEEPDDEVIYLKGLEIAKTWLKSLGWRDDMLDKKIFGDRCWEMMLQVYCAEHEKYEVKVTSLTPGAPPNSASRRSIKLEKMGLVVRVDDPTDKRRLLVRLTDKGRRWMREYLDRLVKAGT